MNSFATVRVSYTLLLSISKSYVYLQNGIFHTDTNSFWCNILQQNAVLYVFWLAQFGDFMFPVPFNKISWTSLLTTEK